MATDILGIHHVTALCGAPLPNLRFYRDVLGLRLVKQTVNFDNPKSYHFYFGDRTGRPGTLITFFPHPVFRAGERGAREVGRTDFAVPAGSLGYWSERLKRSGLWVTPEAAFGGRERLSFADHDGTLLSVVEEDLSAVNAEPPAASDVPVGHAVAGVASVAAVVNDLGPTAEFLTGTLGFTNLGSGGPRTWFGVSPGVPGQRLEVIEDPGVPPAVLGTGSVHHVAWRVADASAEARVRSLVDGKVTGLTAVRDRHYFESIYFREPGGVLFEVATDVPGFLVDEDEATLGTALKLPARFEPRRAEIEGALPTLEEERS
jgi:glyoxalase family protein